MWIVCFPFSLFAFTLKDTQKKMKRRNYIEIREFILLGLSDDPQLHVVSCVFLLTTYMLSITGNLTINHPNPDGCSPTDPHVFLPQKFFHIRGVIHNCHCTQIPYHHYYRRENLLFYWLYDSLFFVFLFFLFCFVFPFSYESLSFAYWLPSLLTITLPSANSCITWASWIIDSAHYLSWLLGWLHP